jgi:tRNA (adenine22-N1)-methyltransferase
MLSRRLEKLASYVEATDILGDIGTDHGYIPIYLIENNVTNQIIASDLNQGPLDNAKEELSQRGLMQSVDLRLGGGLEPYTPGEINTALIAGMGGTLIKNILEDGQEHLPYLKKLILQPMHGVVELRRFLLNNGYRIVDEDLIYENNIYYEIIVAKHGEAQDYDHMNLEFGFHMLEKDPELSKTYVGLKLEKLEAIVDNITKHGSSASQEKIKELRESIEEYKEVIQCL